ncbi:MAG: prepilin-type N-terminal cleavage/methylation domain-containing protein [Candidatus Peribacteria bacterium]|jgi:prepilin-type N-terminal cleavage/methylation domain-containing protein|nr:prepilin-type N-terminal cleavage/methylation domain-containing protein [Candidatus Peribacteria bacterium]
MNSLDFARSKHSPLNKGRQEGILRGFTLVELIVVVTILAIL